MQKEIDYLLVGKILGIVGFFLVPLAFGILAIVFGALAEGNGQRVAQGKQWNLPITLGFINVIWWMFQIRLGIFWF